MRRRTTAVVAATVLSLAIPGTSAMASPGAGNVVARITAAGASELGGSAATTRTAGPDDATSADVPSLDAPRPDRKFRLLRLSIDKRVIDVTRAARTVTITVRVSHPRKVVEGNLVVGLQTSAGAPIGNFEPSGSAAEVRTRGTVSVFRTTLTFPRYAQPSTFDTYVDYNSTRNTFARVVRRAVVQVKDSDADYLPPRIVSLRIRAQGGLPVDVRRTSKRVRVLVHIVDDRSGPDWARSAVELRAIDPENRIDDSYYLSMRLVSGTRRDGVWAGSVRMSAQSTNGDWDTRIALFDVAHDPGDAYSGPLWRDYLPLPGAAGPFTVLGRGDGSRPLLRTVAVTPTTAVQRPDGLAVRVTVTARITDTGGRGVRRVIADLRAGQVVATQPASGTRADGVWRLTLDVPTYLTGTPTTYWLRLQVADTHHLRWYVAPGAPSEGWGAEVPFTRAQLGSGSATATVTTTPPAPAVGA